MKKSRSNKDQPSVEDKQLRNLKDKYKSVSMSSVVVLTTSEEKIQIAIANEFESLMTNFNKSVYDLSKDHKVVCLFIKWFGCPMCQEVIEEVGKNLKTMIQMNTFPVIVHQERDEVAIKYFKNTKDLNVCHIPFAKTSTKLQELLGIDNASLYNHAEAMIKTDLLNLMIGPKKRNFTIPLNVSNPFSKFGIIFVENGAVKREVIFSKLYKRIDFGMFLNDVSSYSTFDSKILQYFKDFQSSLKEKVSILPTHEMDTKNLKKISSIVQSDLGRFYFKAFATSEYSIENISFYEQVMVFKNMKNSKSYELSAHIEKIEEMFETFLKPSSIMQLNTTDEMIYVAVKGYQEIKEGKVENIENLFDDILGDIMVVLEDTYSRFKFSRYCTEYEKALSSTNQTINYLI
jgi:hypothetical protein